MNLSAKNLRTIGRKLVRRAESAALRLGDVVECPFCGWTGWRFLSCGDPWRPNRLCPCGSLERHRMLALLLDRELAGRRSVDLLEIAPKACLEKLSRRRGWRYVSSDLDDPKAMVRADLRAMPMPDDSFDVISCFHVMEHILDDVPAYAEMRRLLRPGGFAAICVPLGVDRTQEGAERADWKRLYGQSDHVRLYGMDIIDRMAGVGLDVQKIDSLHYFSDAELTRHGLRGDDRYIFLVRKAAAT